MTSEGFLRVLKLVLILACLMYVAACERPTSVVVNAGPTFLLSGSGRLEAFTIYAPVGHRIASGSPSNDKVIWQIKASKGYFSGTYVKGMHLTFGKVPDGYNQTVPDRSQEAPSLPPGTVYAFTAETTNAPGIGGFFYIRRNGATQVNVPDLCLKLINGQDVRVRCGTSEPYQEPSDLEAFVREHASGQATQ